MYSGARTAIWISVRITAYRGAGPLGTVIGTTGIARHAAANIAGVHSIDRKARCRGCHKATESYGGHKAAALESGQHG